MRRVGRPRTDTSRGGFLAVLVALGLGASVTHATFAGGLQDDERGSPSQTPAGQEESGDAPKPAPKALPPGVLARVNGKDITVESYSLFLFARFGKAKLDELINRVLVEEDAARLEIVITPEDVEKEVESRVQALLHGVFKGSMERLTEDLERRGSSLAEHRGRLAQTVAYDLLRDSSILKTREISERDIRERFEAVYGPGGVRNELRHVLIAAASPGRPNDADGKPLPDRATARATAEKVLEAARAGADFVELVREHSDDVLTRANDGRIPVYRKNALGEAFHRAVESLTEDAPLSDVVESPRGFHVVLLVRREVTELDAKREEIVEHLRTRPPTARERQAYLGKLRKAAKIEK